MCLPWEAIVAIVAVIAGSVVALFVEPLRSKFELKRIYLAPFRKWCADFHGELDEFWTKYFSCTVKRADYPNVEIIDDWRALHEAAIDGPKWLAKVKKKKKDENVARKLGDMLGIIDHLWHELEENYNVRLKDRFDIISLGKIMRTKMADDLWNARNNISGKVSDEDERAILLYLKKWIP